MNEDKPITIIPRTGISSGNTGMVLVDPVELERLRAIEARLEAEYRGFATDAWGWETELYMQMLYYRLYGEYPKPGQLRQQWEQWQESEDK